MELNWFESLLFGFISGLTEFLPVSAAAHESLMQKLLGGGDSPLLRFMVHGAALLALYFSLRQHISHLLRERQLSKIPPRRRKRQPDAARILELRLLKTAMITMLVLLAVYYGFIRWKADLSMTALFLVLNGLILYIPGHMPNGNKDERSMSALDGVLLGISGAAAVLPGISGVGAAASAGIARGADKENALRWATLLCIPALLVVCGMDAFALFTVGAALSPIVVFQCILAAAASFGGASFGISVMRFLAVRTGFSGFAYYCWGAALFSFLMYLTV